MNKKIILKTKTDDFRRVEKHVEESTEGNVTERITTVREEVIPFTTTKVVKENIVPVITSRKIDTYEDGKIVDTKHEAVPEESLKLNQLEHKFALEEFKKLVEDALKSTKTGNPVIVVKDHAVMPPKKVEFEVNSNLILYIILAAESALIVYSTVLKGWLVN